MPAANRANPAHPRLPRRSGWRTAALIYTVTGAVCLLASAVMPESDVGMLAAIAGGLPWSLSLLTLGLAPGVASTALLLLAASWAINAALLWWLALRRPRIEDASHLV